MREAVNLAHKIFAAPRSWRTIPDDAYSRLHAGFSFYHVGTKDKKTSKGKKYNNPEDSVCLPLIRERVDERMSYGYRRIHPLLNSRIMSRGLKWVNHERGYCIMHNTLMLVSKSTGNPPDRSHDGRVSTKVSNHRWCADEMTIPREDREVIRVIFALDTCSFYSHNSGISLRNGKSPDGCTSISDGSGSRAGWNGPTTVSALPRKKS